MSEQRESGCFRKGFNFHRIGLIHQYGRPFHCLGACILEGFLDVNDSRYLMPCSLCGFSSRVGMMYFGRRIALLRVRHTSIFPGLIGVRSDPVLGRPYSIPNPWVGSLSRAGQLLCRCPVGFLFSLTLKSADDRWGQGLD